MNLDKLYHNEGIEKVNTNIRSSLSLGVMLSTSYTARFNCLILLLLFRVSFLPALIHEATKSQTRLND